MKRPHLFGFVILVTLAGCSSKTISTSPTAEEAQAAINSVPSGQAIAGQKPPAIYVTNVAVGACKSSTTNPLIVCDTTFTWQGSPVKTKVMYWTTRNPRHPWRAQFIPNHPAR